MSKTDLPQTLYVLLITLVLLGCAGKEDTIAINEMVDNGVKHAEKHRISDLMAMTYDDFSAQQGRYNARSVRPILFAAFKHYGKFEIHYPRPHLDVSRNTAAAVVYFVIVSRDRTLPDLKDLYDNPKKWLEVAGEKADLYRLKLELRKKGGKWKVNKADIEGFKGIGF